ncbi:MAG: 2-amino-4-hydroxy-6-hydroxymethyldihydropteridine diphosphokinase [Clostridiales bacterium]|nr:2-amino-4-hydroxy-6-hydroxymethyldihydropteridine diphosphokinase [Clostridiales bacterium]
MTEAFLSLGSNMGDRLENLTEAVRMLKEDPKIESIECSPVFETDPVGYTEQDAFLNICVKLKTSHTPISLLDQCQKIESALHRVRKIHWGPRTIDLDILTFGEERIDSKRLQIPHPRMEERGFVQVPLLFLGGETEIPEKWKDAVRYYGVMPDTGS